MSLFQFVTMVPEAMTQTESHGGPCLISELVEKYMSNL